MTMRRIAVLAGFVLAGFVPLGCATATIEDAVPAGALAGQPQGMEAEEAEAGESETEATMPEAATAPAGVYPNLNVPAMVAAPQISAQEKTKRTTELRERRAQLAHEAAQQDVSDEGDALRRLAESHADEVLKEIEGK